MDQERLLDVLGLTLCDIEDSTERWTVKTTITELNEYYFY